jgi:bifunctional non-homologous end joining protein LigD
MPLARLATPFDHPDFIFEPKMDGFRAVAYVEGGACRLVSRNRNMFKTFKPLAKAIAQDLSGRSAILDGEIVRPGPDGRPLLERKALLRKLLPLEPRAARYVEHVASGTELFRAVCELDMEGIVAKQAAGLYTPERTSWVKIKNPTYSQAAGRSDFFDRRRAQ